MKVLSYRGYNFINLSPHSLIFEDGVVLEPYDEELTKRVFANAVESDVPNSPFVHVSFQGTEEGESILKKLRSEGYMPISSIINAQAYPCLCCSPIVTKNTQRAPPDQKRVVYRFTVYEEVEDEVEVEKGWK